MAKNTKKKINTIVEDIYNVFMDNQEPSPKHLDEMAKDIRDSVLRQITEVREQKGYLRLSQIGKPDRKTWYDIKGAPKDVPDGPVRMKFLMGDIYEALLILLIKTSGHVVTDEQKEVEVEGVKGHKDLKIDGINVDIKSASAYGFKKFKNNTLDQDDPFGYIAQLSSYAQSEGATEAAFLAIDKSSCEVALTPLNYFDMINSHDRVKHLKGIVKSDTVPERCYSDEASGTSGNRILSKPCSWCEFHDYCWSDANQGVGLRHFKYAEGIKKYTNVAKEPKVEEVTPNA